MALDVQQDEMESMAAIFAEDFHLCSQEPISYSIHLKKAYEQYEFGASAAFVEEHKLMDEYRSLRYPDDLKLKVTYPPTYPDSSVPIFDIVYDKMKITLHDVQEEAILKTVRTIAYAELGMPCVYSCICAAKEFLDGGGLSQAGLALLSDDCLANVLAYLATSKDELDEICLALPIFTENAAKTNLLWKQLCKFRWKDKWGYEERWERALQSFEVQPDEHYWMQKYHIEEEDAKRNHLTLNELYAMKFDMRLWFSFSLLRRQPQNMRDVMPTGLRQTVASNLVLTKTGDVTPIRHFTWTHDDAEVITQITIKSLGDRKCYPLTVTRLPNWGWELRGTGYVCRAVDKDKAEDIDEIWEDLISTIIIQQKPDWVSLTRRGGQYPYSYREIPDDEDCKMLPW